MEVKNSRNVYAKDLRGLRSFKQDYPEAALLLLYRGKDRLLIDDVFCMPVEQFLKYLAPTLSVTVAIGEKFV